MTRSKILSKSCYSIEIAYLNNKNKTYLKQSKANWTTITYDFKSENSSYIVVVIDNSAYPETLVGANFNDNLGLTLQTLTQFDLRYTYYYTYKGSNHLNHFGSVNYNFSYIGNTYDRIWTDGILNYNVLPTKELKYTK